MTQYTLALTMYKHYAASFIVLVLLKYATEVVELIIQYIGCAHTCCSLKQAAGMKVNNNQIVIRLLRLSVLGCVERLQSLELLVRRLVGTNVIEVSLLWLSGGFVLFYIYQLVSLNRFTNKSLKNTSSYVKNNSARFEK